MPRQWVMVAFAATLSCHPSAKTEGALCREVARCMGKHTCRAQGARKMTASATTAPPPAPDVARPRAPCHWWFDARSELPSRDPIAAVTTPEAEQTCEQPAGSALADEATRRVSFRVYPSTAAVHVAGRKLTLLRPHELTVGPHTIGVFAEGHDAVRLPLCVRPTPPGESDRPQVVAIQLRALPAAIVLTETAASGSVSCDGRQLRAGLPATLPMDGVHATSLCQVEPGGRSCTIPLQAGRTTHVRWD